MLSKADLDKTERFDNGSTSQWRNIKVAQFEK
jgi:hypothetical protein